VRSCEAGELTVADLLPKAKRFIHGREYYAPTWPPRPRPQLQPQQPSWPDPFGTPSPPLNKPTAAKRGLKA
jgi:hypothetical protein